jgi:hypothetical protein
LEPVDDMRGCVDGSGGVAGGNGGDDGEADRAADLLGGVDKSAGESGLVLVYAGDWLSPAWIAL